MAIPKRSSNKNKQAKYKAHFDKIAKYTKKGKTNKKKKHGK